MENEQKGQWSNKHDVSQEIRNTETSQQEGNTPPNNPSDRTEKETPREDEPQSTIILLLSPQMENPGQSATKQSFLEERLPRNLSF